MREGMSIEEIPVRDRQTASKGRPFLLVLCLFLFQFLPRFFSFSTSCIFFTYNFHPGLKLADCIESA